MFSIKGKKMKIDLNDKVVRFLVQEYVNHICNYCSAEELNFNVHKLIHTFKVVEMAQQLIKLTKPALTLKLQAQILNAAVLHDLGHCYTFRKGLKLKNIDHGKIGADLIKKQFPKMKEEMQSTLFHNKCPSSKDPKSVQLILDYVRDADMLANIQYNMEHLDIFLMHIYRKKSSGISEVIIDDEIVNAAVQKRPARTSKVKAYGPLTLFLWQMCWWFNLSTISGKKLSKKNHLFTRFRDMICQRVVPMTTEDKKNQKKLIQKIHQIFPDKIFSD